MDGQRIDLRVASDAGSDIFDARPICTAEGGPRLAADQRAPRIVPAGHPADQGRWRFHWRPIWIALAMKALVLLIGTASFMIRSDEGIDTVRDFLGVWERWDTIEYLTIARHGYDTDESRRLLVFLPLFPWSVRLLGWITGDYLVGSLVVSSLASLAVAVLLDRLVRLDHPRELAHRAVWFLFIFPTSYFLHVGYTESLFLALVLGSLLAARRGHWLAAGLLGALAGLTRINGVIIIPTLLVEVLIQYRTTRRWRWQYLWIGLASLGFAGYLLVNYLAAGDPFAFRDAQEAYATGRTSTWPWLNMRDLIGSIDWYGPGEASTGRATELLFVLLGLAGTVVTWVMLRPSYGVWMSGNWLLFVSTGYILSVPRYTLVLFPLYILFAWLAARKDWFAAITVGSLLHLALATAQFAMGRWAY